MWKSVFLCNSREVKIILQNCLNLRQLQTKPKSFNGSAKSFNSRLSTVPLTTSRSLGKKICSEESRNIDLSHFKIKEYEFRQKYAWMSRMDKGVLQQKHSLIRKMNFKDSKHSLPLYKLPIKTLNRILKCINKDKEDNFCENRLYYLSDKLQCDPFEFSEHMSKKPFLYYLSFDWLTSSLNVLLEMGIPLERIRRDLCVLKYNHETIRNRLEAVVSSGRNDLAPWMVRCSQDVLERSLEIYLDTKNILGNNASVKAYLQERLNTTPEVIDAMCHKIPSVERLRVTKAKDSLDFLFSQGYSKEDVIQVPRILAHSLQTVIKRLTRIQSAGIKVTRNLNLLCKSNKDFEKFYETNCSLMKRDEKDRDGNGNAQVSG